MAADGVTRALGVILSVLRTEASWERYQQNIADARAPQGSNAPTIDYCGGWHNHPRFIQTWAEQLRLALRRSRRTSASPPRSSLPPPVFQFQWQRDPPMSNHFAK